jgi:hypothetical protein
MTTKPDIFFSYKREDLERVQPIVEVLERAGYSVWWDRKLVPGEEWERRISEVMREALSIVVAWTRRSVSDDLSYASDRVHSEADEGRKRDVLVPALLDTGRIPDHHKRVQFADLTDWAGQANHTGIRKLIAGVERCAGRRFPPTTAELEAWRIAESSNSRDALEKFALEFPDSRYRDMALSRMTEIDHAAIAPVFFIEDDDKLRGLYPKERCLSYPFSDSQQQIAYVPCTVVNENLDWLVVDVLARPWHLSEQMRLFTDASFRDWLRYSERTSVYERLHEARNARCAALVSKSGLLSMRPRLTIQQTGFQDYLRSNLLMDYVLPGRRSLRQLVHPDGRLDEFHDSELSNTIGINVLIVNPAGDVPLQIRSGGVSIRAGQVCSSASGTFEVADVKRSGMRLAQCELLRELEEELGVEIRNRCVGAPTIVGLARELARGGQLELFVVVDAHFSREDVEASIRRARDRHEWLAIDYLELDRSGQSFSRQKAQIAISNMEERHKGKISSPLRAHLSLWLRYLDAQKRLI